MATLIELAKKVTRVAQEKAEEARRKAEADYFLLISAAARGTEAAEDRRSLPGVLAELDLDGGAFEADVAALKEADVIEQQVAELSASRVQVADVADRAAEAVPVAQQAERAAWAQAGRLARVRGEAERVARDSREAVLASDRAIEQSRAALAAVRRRRPLAFGMKVEQ